MTDEEENSTHVTMSHLAWPSRTIPPWPIRGNTGPRHNDEVASRPELLLHPKENAGHNAQAYAASEPAICKQFRKWALTA